MTFESAAKREDMVTGREWADYERNLCVTKEFCDQKRILNFGCGGSNIGKKLETSEVVDVDILAHPISSWQYTNPHIYHIANHVHRNDAIRSKLGAQKTLSNTSDDLREVMGKIAERKEREYNSDQPLLPSIQEHEDEQFGIEGRHFVRSDGMPLPFPDRHFDITLASYSTYLIPLEHKATVFSELLRTSNIVHIAPIDTVDYDMLRELAEKQGFVILHVNEVGRIGMKAEKLRKFIELDSLADYRDLIYTRKIPPTKRMDIGIEPHTQKRAINAQNEIGFSLIILGREEFLNKL